MSYLPKSVYCRGWKKVIMKETMISFSFEIVLDGRRQPVFWCVFSHFNRRPIWQSILHGGGKRSAQRPSSFLAESGRDGTAVAWPPSMGGGSPGGRVQMCVCGEASEMTAEPGGFQSSCDSGSRPPSLLLAARGVNFWCLRRRGACDFYSFFNFSSYFYIFWVVDDDFLTKERSPLFTLCSRRLLCKLMR